MLGAVGIELLTKLNKSHTVAVLPTVYEMNWSQMELNWFGRFKLTWRTSGTRCPMTSYPIFSGRAKKVDRAPQVGLIDTLGTGTHLRLS